MSDVPLHALDGTGPRLTARALPRRTVLRGIGTALALPALEAMAVARPGAASPPTRLVYVYSPNGVDVANWRLESGPLPAELPASLVPFAPWRADVRQLRGLDQRCARANGDGPGDHARAAAVWLTGVQPLKSEGRVRLGVSADQIAARVVGGATRIPSLQLGTERGRTSGQCDSGYACAYSNNVSWADETTPVAKETDPRRAFDRLFRGGDQGLDPAAAAERRSTRRSVLDFVRADVKRLEGRLGESDRRRLDQYATGVRELERRLDAAQAAIVESVSDDARPGAAPREFSAHARLLSDVLALSLESDVTRIATFMLGNEGSQRRYVEVGVREGHHTLSHHGKDHEKLAQIQRIDRLHAETVVHLVERLAAVREGDDRLLDRTMLVHGSCIADGNRHDHHDLPTLLIGGARVGLGDGDVCRRFPKGTPLGDLHLALVSRLGGELPEGLSYGDARGPLDLASGTIEPPPPPPEEAGETPGPPTSKAG